MSLWSGVRRARSPERFVVLMVAILISQVVKGQVAVQSSSFDNVWLEPDDALTIQVDRLPDPNEGNLRLVVGNVDVTPLLRANADGEIILDTTMLALPRGTNDVVLYLVTTAGEWQEVSRQPLQVRLPGGFETSEFNPQVNLSNKGQLEENSFGDAVEPERPEYQDLAGQIGFTSRHTRGDLEVRSSLNMVGSSVRQEALRFGEKGTDAPKLDLSDYLVEVEKGRASLAVGNVYYGNHPLLINGIGNRGIKGQYRINDRLDVSVASMNGTSIVGYSNILGLNTLDHNISAATVGFEVLKSRPGGLRMEVTYMDASIESLFNFDVGEVPDAETNRGVGLRLMGSNASGRLRGDFSIAKSRYRNPNDPFLAQGNALVKSKSTTDVARRLEVSYDILQNKPLTETLFASLSFSFLHDRTDPLYKSVASFSQADWEANQFSLNGQLGQVSMLAQYTKGEDNIDDLKTILKTRTESTSASINAPMAFLFGNSQDPSAWWPNLSYNYNRTHQFALNDPDAADSGFNGGSHLPDQMTTSHGVGVQWMIKRWSMGYRLALNDQDNRQVGRKTADFKVVTHDINLGVQATDSINLSGSVGLGTNDDQEQNVEQETRSWGANANWRITPRWALSGNYNITEQDDSRNRAESDSQTANAQVNWSFTIPAAGRKLPGQAFVRYAFRESNNKDQFFGFESNLRSWTINSGISLSLF